MRDWKREKEIEPQKTQRGHRVLLDCKDMKAVKEMSNFDVNKIRKDFPVLSQTVNGKPLVGNLNARGFRSGSQYGRVCFRNNKRVFH